MRNKRFKELVLRKATELLIEANRSNIEWLRSQHLKHPIPNVAKDFWWKYEEACKILYNIYNNDYFDKDGNVITKQ
jgi:hypothetical protein